MTNISNIPNIHLYLTSRAGITRRSFLAGASFAAAGMLTAAGGFVTAAPVARASSLPTDVEPAWTPAWREV